MSTPVHRPSLRGFVYYAMGGTLDASYHEWVRRDLTYPGWRFRHVRRSLVQVGPFLLVFMLLPGPGSLRATIVVMLLLAAIGMGLGTSGYFRNQRLIAHGFPPVRPAEDEDTDPDAPPPGFH